MGKPKLLFNIILFRPEIPQNTGSIGRMCAIANCALHLIHPLGFSVSDKYLRRSGMDYWDELSVFHYDDWEAFWQSEQRPARIWLFTTKAKQGFWDVGYEEGDGLLFGSEGAGVTDAVHAAVGDAHRVKIPHFNPTTRSHNLATSAGIATYEALRQVKGS